MMWWLIPAFIKSFLETTFHEFQAPVWPAKAYLDDLRDFWARHNHSKRELIEAGQDLARSRAVEQFNREQNQILSDEIDRLNALLNLPSRAGYRYEFARVVRRDIHAWWQQITIGKGKNFDIPVGVPVVFSGGIVGRVATVGLYTATVELISSPGFRMIAMFENDNRPVTYQGRVTPPLAPPGGRVYTVQQDVRATTEKPRLLISSGLGGIFPPGLAIGTVEVLEPSSDGLFQRGKVLLDKRLLALREVAVLLSAQ